MIDKRITECIILAGGLGTRLRSVVPDAPKCMALVNDKPFITYLISYLQSQGIQRFIFSVGYLHQIIVEFINKEYPKLEAAFVVEEKPLGTGGAIKKSCGKVSAQNVLVVNGDTLCKANFTSLINLHVQQKADCTLSLQYTQNADRYGLVQTDESGKITGFAEKRTALQGLINGGLYIIDVPKFVSEDLPDVFSFEKDYLEALYTKKSFYGLLQNEYFIDIGIPEDYERAQKELKIEE